MNIDLYENFDEIKNDTLIEYKRFNKSTLAISSIIKYCQKPYSIIINLSTDKIVAIIDITNKSIIRFTSNKTLETISKVSRCTLTKINHL